MFGVDISDAASRREGDSGGTKSSSENGRFVRVVRVQSVLDVEFMSRPLVYDLHYGRRTLLCTGQLCGICGVQKPRSMAYAAASFRGEAKGCGLFEVSFGVLVALAAVVQAQVVGQRDVFLGCIARFRRVRGCLRSAVAGEYLGHRDGARTVGLDAVESGVFRVLGIPSPTSFGSREEWEIAVSKLMLARFQEKLHTTTGGTLT